MAIRSKCDRDRLKTELTQCRKAGFAFDMGELNPGINVIASPVFDSQGTVDRVHVYHGDFSEIICRKIRPHSGRKRQTILFPPRRRC